MNNMIDIATKIVHSNTNYRKIDLFYEIYQKNKNVVQVTQYKKLRILE